jgi:uncharacterized membrane protein YoaT (DUF817 family)
LSAYARALAWSVALAPRNGKNAPIITIFLLKTFSIFILPLHRTFSIRPRSIYVKWNSLELNILMQMNFFTHKKNKNLSKKIK